MEIDLSYLEDITGGDKEMMLEMLNLFLEDIPSQVELIKTAVEEKNLKAVGTESHKLKPALQYVGFNEMYELVKELEIIGKSGDKHEEAKKIMPALEEQLKISLPLLEKTAKKFS
ncbi:MAG: Hpt domain-containing protein [Balneola sp.]